MLAALRNLSTTRKLWLVVAVFLVIIAAQVALSLFGLRSLSVLRAYATAESFWSKSQKLAVYRLRQYATTREPGHYAAFRSELEVIRGDAQARLELLTDRPNYARARAGFVRGRNHPADVDEMIRVFHRFRDLEPIRRAIVIWGRGDRRVAELVALAERVRHLPSDAGAAAVRAGPILEDLDRLDIALTGLEQEFSIALGDAARMIRRLLGWSQGALLTVLLGLGLGLSAAVSRQVGAEVTERRKAEAALLQAQKMEAVGRLAGGIAHDFNNLLTVILGHAELLAEHGRADRALGREVESIQAAGHRAAELTHHLLAFGRKQMMERRVIDLGEAVRDATAVLRRMIGDDVVLVLDLEPGPLPVDADRTQLDQVLMNLAVNSRDAMPSGGRILIRTTTEELEAAAGGGRFDVVPGSYALLEVADNGQGMPAEVQEHAFDPFFTTKEPGKGTGLGLSMVYGIVKQHEGYVFLESEPGRGTACRIYLPLSDAAIEQPARRTAVVVPVAVAHGATVLVVEDQQEVRTLLCRVLEGHGYRVLAAADGPAALAVASRHEGGIDVLVTDLVMPHMSGEELARRVTEARPEIAVLYISGYSEQRPPALGGESEWAATLPKPFRPEELVAAVVRTLAEQHGARAAGEPSILDSGS